MVAELLATVTQLRTTIDQQQAHIQYLVRRTLARTVYGPDLSCSHFATIFLTGAPKRDQGCPTMTSEIIRTS
jgi:hypothetical protein